LETICPFELKFFVEVHFARFYLIYTRNHSEIDQSIAMDCLRNGPRVDASFWLIIFSAKVKDIPEKNPQK
jgi:hypothetical protein